MNKTLLVICIIIVNILALYFLINMSREGFKNKNKKTDNNKNNCDKNGCPVTNSQNAIYKIHVEYKPMRDKNHMIANHSQTGSFFSKTKGPSNIFIIRHGEKIKSKNALDCNGILRSTYIPTLVSTINKKGFGIHAIVTAYDYDSMHQEQTVSLTSWIMDIPIYMYGEQSETDVAVTNVFTNPFFCGKTVLFCWEHTCIQSIIKNITTIGAKNKRLNNYQFKNEEGNSAFPYWDDNNYKSIIHFDENLNYSTSEEKFTSCFTQENHTIRYDKEQICK